MCRFPGILRVFLGFTPLSPRMQTLPSVKARLLMVAFRSLDILRHLTSITLCLQMLQPLRRCRSRLPNLPFVWNG
jgi:hypothetical protein